MKLPPTRDRRVARRTRLFGGFLAAVLAATGLGALRSTPASAVTDLFNNIGSSLGNSVPETNPSTPQTLTFTASSSGTARTMSMWVQCVGINCNVAGTMTLRGATGSTVLASGTFNASDSSTLKCTVLTGTPALSAGTSYRATMTVASGSIVWNTAGSGFSLRITDGTACGPQFASSPTPGASVANLITRNGGKAFDTIAITNPGQDNLRVTSAAITGANASSFSLLDGEPNGRPPGQALTFPQTVAVGLGGTTPTLFIYVVCTGGTPDGIRTANLRLATNDPAQPTADYPLECLVDSTPPTVEFDQTPTGQNGWFTSTPAPLLVRGIDPESNNAVKNITCTDNGNPALNVPAGATTYNVTGEGAHNVSCKATDVADNVSSNFPTTVKIDTTKPTLAVTPTPPSNAAGWWKTNVSLAITCTDAVSGPNPASFSPTASVTTDTTAAGQSFSCSDVAGNTSTPFTVRRDTVAPTSTVAGVTDGAVYLGSAPTATCQSADALSGIKTPATPQITAAPQSNVSALPATGTFTVTCNGAVDKADNVQSSPSTVTYQVVPRPDLAITKSHSGNFFQGQTGASYTIEVKNISPTSITGLVMVTDTAPAGLTATALSGNGWTCDLEVLVCHRSDGLAGNASYPPITITFNVAADAAASVTNRAVLTSASDTNASNNTADDVTTILAASPDLTITKSHTGSFFQGQTGATYTLKVSNVSSTSTATTGLVTVTDTLPAGLSATGASGFGWTCFVVSSAAICTRDNPLAAGSAYPDITVFVNVAANAAASVTNTVTVSGGGDQNSSNNTATDPTTVDTTVRDLTITKSHTGNFLQGQIGAAYTLKVSNVSPTSTASTGLVTVTDTLPAGLTANNASGSGWSCSSSGSGATCSRNDSLAAGFAYPDITLVVTVAADAPASVTNTATVSGGGDQNSNNNTATDPTTVNPTVRDVTIAKSHTGNFTQGQLSATYTLKVSNVSPTSTATTGLVTVTDTLPTGLTATALSGNGWTCTVATASCTRSDVLGAAASYPDITVTVNVAANAPASVTNTATVSGGGDQNSNNNVATDPTTINAPTPLRLYPDTVVPPESVNLGATYPVQTAQRINFTCDGSVTGVWWYRVAGDTGTNTVQAWRGNTLVASGSGNPSGFGWAFLPFTAPVSVANGDQLLLGVHHPNGAYGFNSTQRGPGNGFDGRSVTATCLRSPASTAAARNGLYSYSATPVLPTLSYASSEYFISPSFATVVAPPSVQVSIADAATTEGTSGTKQLTFNVTLNAASAGVVTVRATTADGTATAGSDYVAVGPITVTFNPGETLKTVVVDINGDTTPEPDETFTVQLNNVTGAGAVIARATATGTITNDDTAPQPKPGLRLYADTVVPPQTVSLGATYAVETAQRINFTCDGTVTGVWWYRVAGDTGNNTVSAWRAGSLVASGSANPATMGWSFIPFTTPLTVTNGEQLVFGVHHPNGAYGVNNTQRGAGNGFDGRTVTSSCMRSPATSAGAPNGLYAYSPTPVLPTLSYAASEYFISPNLEVVG